MPPRGIGLGRGMRHLRYGSSHHGGLSYRPDVPLTLGHEPAGVVTEVNDTRDQTLLGRASYQPSSWAARTANPAFPAMNA